MENINIDEKENYYCCPTCKFLPKASSICTIANHIIPALYCHHYEHKHAYKNKTDQIWNRLMKTTAGTWRVVKPGSERLSTNGNKYKTEDYAILTNYDTEVLGTSEWLRCDLNDLEFMAHAKEDIKYLLELLEEKEKL